MPTRFPVQQGAWGLVSYVWGLVSYVCPSHNPQGQLPQDHHPAVPAKDRGSIRRSQLCPVQGEWLSEPPCTSNNPRPQPAPRGSHPTTLHLASRSTGPQTESEERHSSPAPDPWNAFEAVDTCVSRAGPYSTLTPPQRPIPRGHRRLSRRAPPCL